MENLPKAQHSQERTNSYHNTPYAIAIDFNRIFYCNAVMFLNSGTSNVYINDVFLLIPGASLEIGANQNEVDLTSYKVYFRGTGTNLVQMWIKQDDGNWEQFTKYPWNAFYTKEPNKKGFIPAGHSRMGNRNGGGAQKGDANNKWLRRQGNDF